ncbi:MAG TPA: hypothetical protein VM261_17475, partial [Kofleriaceae bacterium]|nr:hypothetical protein [Kofleriaceae bacterium]
MRRLPSLNVLLICVAAMGALALTITRRSPGGVVSYTVEPRQARAAPGEKATAKPRLSELEIF